MIVLLSISLLILLGALGTLAGLLGIAAQVRVHHIQVYSLGSWVFRIGLLLTALGLALTWVAPAPLEFRQTGWVMGLAGLTGGLVTWGHEYHQALEQGAAHWDWPRSLTLQMALMGLAVLALGLAAARQ